MYAEQAKQFRQTFLPLLGFVFLPKFKPQAKRRRGRDKILNEEQNTKEKT